MKPPSYFLPALVLALSACSDETAGPEPAPEGIACPLTERVRLASPPGGFTPGDLYYDLRLVGDHLLFTFDGPDDPGRTYWHTSRCGGEVEEFTSLPPGMVLHAVVATDAGPALYALDPLDGQAFLLDRLDVPGFDEPSPILGLPALFPLGHGMLGSGQRRYADFSAANEGGHAWSAAGIGAITWKLFTHAGDPDVPALQVGAAILDIAHADDHLLVHDDDGTVRRFDPLTGASTTLLTGVRHVSFSPDRTRAIWQQIGDDQVETVYLRDLGAGTDREIAVNDFAQQSWGRFLSGDGLGRDAGEWSWTRDGAFAAMKGLDDTLVAAVRTDTGEPLELPAHVRLVEPMTSLFRLELADPTERVDALWDPATGSTRVWHRGPVTPKLLRDDGTTAELVVFDAADEVTGRLVVLDLATGESTELLSSFSTTSGRLADGVYLYRTIRDFVPLTMSGQARVEVATYDLAFADPATQLYTPIADDISALAFVPDEALILLDAHGDDPGVWAVPYPE